MDWLGVVLELINFELEAHVFRATGFRSGTKELSGTIISFRQPDLKSTVNWLQPKTSRNGRQRESHRTPFSFNGDLCDERYLALAQNATNGQ
jgi:hypothetical protein